MNDVAGLVLRSSLGAELSEDDAAVLGGLMNVSELADGELPDRGGDHR